MALRLTPGIACAALAGISLSLLAAPAQAGTPFPVVGESSLLAHYPFDETTGTVAADRSGNGRHAAIVNGNAATVWNGGRGLTLPGGNGGTAPAVRLPDGLLSGLDDVTIAYDLRLSSATQQGPVFAFGRTADNGGSLTATPGAGTTPHQASIAGPGAGARGADGRRAGVARRERVDARGRDGQRRRNRRARPAPALRGRRADDLEPHADRQAA